jgi:hypothetical protein
MIKRYVLHMLFVLNLALMAVLAWLWLTPQGKLRNVHWQAPAPKAADFSSGLPVKSQVAQIENSRLIGLLDRPLFALTRRPPPPPPPPPVPPPVDTLSTARLVAIYSGSGAGGVVLNLGGKSRRVRLKESVDGWSLTAIEGRSATFAASGQTRILQLGRAALTASSGAPPLSAAPAPPPVSEAPAAPPRRPSGPPRATFGGS